MGNVIYLNSIEDPALDVYARLTEAQIRNRLEPEKGVFIAESPKVIRLALATGFEPVSFLICFCAVRTRRSIPATGSFCNR